MTVQALTPQRRLNTSWPNMADKQPQQDWECVCCTPTPPGATRQDATLHEGYERTNRHHQELLDKMQRYMKGMSEPTDEDSGNVPVRGVIPFNFSNQVSRDVARHVREREKSGMRTSLLCNIGTAGSGQALLLHQITVEAVQMLDQMVGEHVEAAARGSSKEGQYRRRPLGFYVTFNASLTSTDRDKHYLAADRYPILTAIALRVAYSVVVDPSIDYSTFAKRVAKYCNLANDEANFKCIVDALRSIWKWDGPMFRTLPETVQMPSPRATPRRTVGCLLWVAGPVARAIRDSESQGLLSLRRCVDVHCVGRHGFLNRFRTSVDRSANATFGGVGFEVPQVIP
ncbi:multi-copy leucine-rich repeat protein, putative [Bodo saltans]|uniref:Multi-copy leucine-rich repeat protein, putative n=1 Tax=Bodo saltans TaxID=75058 RepID=A0A0S4J7E8_BODSA|nr:multi-copy leucine-rich repeat protein, putative [Bodo saltans]|eukprot:CUG84471.1 multi-copy leucine-rich repeat protein, putative [Bodo saltans]